MTDDDAAPPISACDTPRDSKPTTSRRGALFVLLRTKRPFFSGIVHFSRLAAGIFSYFLLRGQKEGGVDSTMQALAPAGLRGTCSRWSKSRDRASNSGDGLPLPKSHPGAWKPTRIFNFLAAKISLFSLLAASAAVHSAARLRVARAHARALECCSSSTQGYNNSNNRRKSAARVECCSSADECCCCCCCGG